MMTEQGTDQGEKCGTRGSVGMGMHPAQRTRSGAKSTVADVPVLISVGLNVLVRTRQYHRRSLTTPFSSSCVLQHHLLLSFLWMTR